MNGLIYFQHNGQFYKPDTNSKVPLIRGKKLYIETVHDITHFYPKYRHNTKTNAEHAYKMSCDPKLDLNYDRCVIDVRFFFRILNFFETDA